MFPEIGDDPEASVKRVYEAWEQVRANPDSATELWLGHPYRCWTSFLATSTLDGLLRTKAKVFLSQGTADTAVALSGFDMARAELVARSPAVTAERLTGIDHSYNKTGTPAGGPPDGMRAARKRVVDWFADDAKAAPGK